MRNNFKATERALYTGETSPGEQRKINEVTSENIIAQWQKYGGPLSVHMNIRDGNHQADRSAHHEPGLIQH